ncbi:MAG: LysM peptidoglycan-binding domain-containing protein, partial [Thermoanaerobaculia bacterium]
YLIQAGDTLWDLSGRFYGDPYLWPQIWEQNRYIEDAHWIYPGDPLVVGVEVTPITELEEMAEAEPTGMAGETGDSSFDPASGAPVPLGSADDIFCSGYIGDADEEFAMRVVGSEFGGLDVQVADSWDRNRRPAKKTGNYSQPITAKLGLVLGDIVYLDRGANDGLLPGSVYIAVRPDDLIRHIDSREVLGRQYKYLGRVRLLSVQQTTAIGEVVHSCYPIDVGTALKAFEDAPIPLARRTGLRGINDPVSAEVLAGAPVITLAESGHVTLGQGHLVFIDRGYADDVTPGDIYTIYRMNGRGLSPMVVGELAVLSVESGTALGKILESRYAVYVGDKLDPK